VRKTRPLLDVEASQEEAKQQFEKAWVAGELKDWEDSSEKKSQEQGTPGGIWCVACT